MSSKKKVVSEKKWFDDPLVEGKAGKAKRALEKGHVDVAAGVEELPLVAAPKIDPTAEVWRVGGRGVLFEKEETPVGLSVRIESGEVVIGFKEPRTFVSMNAAEATHVAELLKLHAKFLKARAS